MNKRLRCYLRPHRRRWGFTQKELAFIIDTSRAVVSRLEHGRRQPDLMAAFALYIIFGARTYDLFPALFSDVERGVLERAYDLYERLQGNKSRSARMKLDFLEALFERARDRSVKKPTV